MLLRVYAESWYEGDTADILVDDGGYAINRSDAHLLWIKVGGARFDFVFGCIYDFYINDIRPVSYRLYSGSEVVAEYSG